MSMSVIVKSVLLAIFICALFWSVYFAWWVERKINYSYQYKTLVEETVRQMVRPEDLK